MNQVSILHHWWGGLLCSYGLHLAQKQLNVLCLVNFQGAIEAKSLMERIPTPILRQISDSLELPLFMPSTNPESIEKDIQALLTLVNQKYGVHSVVLNAFEQDHRMKILKKNYEGTALHIQNFIEKETPETLFEDAMNLGFKAYIFSINEKILNRSYLGAPLTLEMLTHFKSNNIHPFGARGEFETICTDGPNFKNKIPVNFGDTHFKNGFWYREVISG